MTTLAPPRPTKQEILHYEIHGQGPIDLLFIHGWGSSCRMWDHHFLNGECGANSRLWLLDLPGFGQSPLPETPPSVEDHVNSVIRFCDEHDLRPQIIIGHSMGGLIALGILRVRPDLAQQLALLAPVVTGNYGLQGIASELVRTPVGEAALRNTQWGWRLVQQEYLVQAALTVYHGEQSTLVEQTRQSFIEMNPLAGIEALISMADFSMEPFLGDIPHPTFIAVGERDLTVPPSEGKTAARYMPNAELAVFHDARHRPHDEQPDQFLPKFQDFLTRAGIS